MQNLWDRWWHQGCFCTDLDEIRLFSVEGTLLEKRERREIQFPPRAFVSHLRARALYLENGEKDKRCFCGGER